MSVYLLHFEPRFKHAGHYIGFSTNGDPEIRINKHLRSLSKGSPLVKAALSAGCTVTVAYVWNGAADRHFERSLKTRKDVCKWCPICGRKRRPIPQFATG
jgi:hypothetical protein